MHGARCCLRAAGVTPEAEPATPQCSRASAASIQALQVCQDSRRTRAVRKFGLSSFLQIRRVAVDSGVDEPLSWRARQRKATTDCFP